MNNPTTDTLFKKIGQLSAELYLYYPYTSEGNPRKLKRRNELICLGRDAKTRQFLSKIKMPALPLLLSNKELRESLKPREKSPLFGIVSNAISQKAAKLSKSVTRAIREERQKKQTHILYRLESPKSGEWIDESPLTEEQFKAML